MLLAALSLCVAATAAPPAEAPVDLSYRRPRVLVWDLEGKRVPAGLAEQLTNAVAARLANNPHLEVVSNQDVMRLMGLEASRQALGRPDADRLEKVAASVDAELVVFGSVGAAKAGGGGGWLVQLSLFRADLAKAVARQDVVLATLLKLDEDLGRPADALVGRVLPLPQPDLRAAAAKLVDGLPASVLSSSSSDVTVPRPFLYAGTPFSSAFGAELAGLVAKQLRDRASGKPLAVAPEYTLEGTFLPHADMVEIGFGVVRRQAGKVEVVHRDQVRVLRGAIDTVELAPDNLERVARDAAKDRARIAPRSDLVLDAWTEKGRVGVVFAEGETFHVFLKLNKPGVVRLIYHFADGTSVLMEDAYPIPAQSVGQVVQYGVTFGPAPPFGVERIEALAFEGRPPAVKTVKREIDGTTYDVIQRTRGFIRSPQARAEINITTTP